MRPTWTLFGFVLVLTLGDVRVGGTQVVSISTFPAANPVSNVDIAAAYSGLYFLRSTPNGPELFLQRAYDAMFDPPYTVNFAGGVGGPRIAASGSSGFTVVWQHLAKVWARYLDAAGQPTGTPFQLSSDDGFTSGLARIAGLATGAAIVWSESIPDAGVQLYGQIGSRRHGFGVALQWEVASTPDGGCAVVWHSNDNPPLALRRFDADGDPVGFQRYLDAEAMMVTGLAVAPDGTMAIVGVRPTTTAHEIWAFRFDTNGNALAPEFLVGSAATPASATADSTHPATGFDFAGNLYVVWGDSSPLAPGVHVRGYFPDGTPMGPSLGVSSQMPRNQVRTTRLPNGAFANLWASGPTAYGNVVSLCAPGQAVCGDGVLVPACERCDAGTANDDTTPDACRTSCLPAHCGDGVVDASEQCDDGNFASCDGCTPTCEHELGITCGDGVAACGEQCDDGNAASLDGCTPACTLEPIPGGGQRQVDCFAVWAIDNPTTVPPYDKTGAITAKQRCVDDDPRCDFDGGVPGSCTFHVRGCGNVMDVAGCLVPSRLSSWVLDRPSEAQAAKKPWLAAARASLLGAVPGAIVGPSDRNVCSSRLSVAVPLRGAPGRYGKAKLVIKTRAISYEGGVDKDKINLECVPAGS